MPSKSRARTIATGFAAHCTFALLIVAALAGPSAIANTLFQHELNLPIDGTSRRVTQRPVVEPGQTFVLFDESRPGCIRHWWLTCSNGRDPKTDMDRVHQLRLRFFHDGSAEPSVDMTLGQFYAILLERDTYMVDSAAIKVLPKNAYNCYFPIPFEKLRIELENTGPDGTTIWFMADWQEYGNDVQLTPLRLHAVHRREAPAEPFGSLLMAEFQGRGFIAGMVQAVMVRDTSDAWYHTGGDTFYLDGETAPNPIRGVGGEDVFNMSFGIWPTQTDWVGSPLTEKRTEDNPLGSGYDGVMYRIFGPDPIHFQTSAVLRFGTKANDTESVIYAYLDQQAVPEVFTPAQWLLAGPFACETEEDFDRAEWPEQTRAQWPKEHLANFDPYRSNLVGAPQGPTTFAVPIPLDSEHTWCDFSRCYRGRQRTNLGAQPAEVSAYALGTLQVPEGGTYRLHLGFDDWMRVWLNGNEVFDGRHDKGFAEATQSVDLPAGESSVLVKLSNFDNLQWRLWAFSLRFDPTE